MYMLQGLSDEDSWHLFVLTAFEPVSDEAKAKDPEMTTIGKKIVKKCSNVPLAIKVIGTLLYGQTHRWESFEKNRLPHIETTKNSIMPILKLSYNNLEPSVKCCFKYCALFPKGFVMDKHELISLWMAQGYIGDSEESFLILLKRCFFQDVEKDHLGDIVSLKMHDLMHDLAQEVAGDEIIVGNSLPNDLSKKVRHLFLNRGEWTKSSFPEGNIRTCYMNTLIHSDMVKPLVAKWRFLRSLRLNVLDNAEYLPESIGQLLHLRYLDLCVHNLQILPNSITKLYNFESLILNFCRSLKEWPKDFCKLVNLRLLDIDFCDELTCMPLGIDQLINLRYLTHFKVGGVSSIGKQFGGQLRDIKLLVNLRGKLEISICGNLVSEMGNKWEGGYLEHISNLKAVKIRFYKEARESNNEALIEKLQPNRNLMQLELNGYKGSEIPRWGRAHDDWAIILPYLVKIELNNCERLHGIPLLSNLKHLKELSLYELNNLEYMETIVIGRGGSASKDLPFFPSLESLCLWCLERLKGWWGGVCEGDSSSCMPHWQPPFPRLSIVKIKDCPKLIYLPPCPSLESLEVERSNKLLRILPGEGPANLDLKLNVEVDSVGYLTTLPAGCLTNIMIRGDDELERLSEFEVFKSSSSLQILRISKCRRLTSVFSGVLEHLTALEFLSLYDIPVVDEEFDDDMPWRSLRQNLRTLVLQYLDNFQILPKGMKHLAALQVLTICHCKSLKGLPDWISCLSSLRSLAIGDCPNLNSLDPIQYITSLQSLSISDYDSLKDLPEWISCLSSLQSLGLHNCPNLKSLGALQNITSLQKLEILNCPELREACKEQSGKEWPNIQHIPHISFSSSYW